MLLCYCNVGYNPLFEDMFLYMEILLVFSSHALLAALCGITVNVMIEPSVIDGWGIFRSMLEQRLDKTGPLSLSARSDSIGYNDIIG